MHCTARFGFIMFVYCVPFGLLCVGSPHQWKENLASFSFEDLYENIILQYKSLTRIKIINFSLLPKLLPGNLHPRSDRHAYHSIV
uniref:Secreted protein n=1 Tax=Romanomermis culicivorax TaxID=13658 RepID=A0A915IAQ8_ROMCU